MKYDIQRIDYIRFFILHKFGGFYIDLDMIAIKPLNTLLKCDMILNNINHLVTNHNEFVINDFMATKKQNSFMMFLIKAVPINYKQKENIEIYKVWKARFVVQTTGPKFISRMVKKYLPNYKPFNVVWTKWRNDNWKKIPRNNYYVECHRAGSWLNETNKNLKNHKTFK
jgi:Mannosyltransferase OCH1 and related enzymes